ncbi:hypothetical protein ACPPVT_20800 [Angustibacter sp. McL0619]|uniref:hypothetical protein n=1 Tax=Angustibacter sp. McL0619 TaxID=3415676 RepID=UPI003CFA7307
MNDHRDPCRWPLRLLVTAASGCLLLAGCSDGQGSGAAPTVTVTATTGTPSGSATASPTVTTDVKGRAFDLGTITAVSTVDGTRVVELDRWTATGTSDSTLAKQGLKVLPHKGSRFTNQNTSKTYTAPVAPGARLVVNTCVADTSGDLGMTSQPISAISWLAKPDRSAVLLVTYDDTGVITRLDTDPICKG